jgi:hypothetical protein
MGASLVAAGLVAVLLPGMGAGEGRSQAATDVRPLEKPAWPCWLVLRGDLREVVELAWDHSASFRHQCRMLGAAGAVLIAESSRKTPTAGTRIGLSAEGVLVARIVVCRCRQAAEYLAHELEHVLERVEGINYLFELGRVGSRVSLSGGAFETRRAYDAGRRVAAEMRAATQASEQARRSAPSIPQPKADRADTRPAAP